MKIPPPRTRNEMLKIMRKAGVKIQPVNQPTIFNGGIKPKKNPGNTGHVYGRNALIAASTEVRKVLNGELMPPEKKEPFGGKQRGKSRKGIPNKITREVKEVIARCFYDIGGSEAFAKWARENQTKFYYLYAKMLPITLQTSSKKELTIIISKDEANL